MLEAFKRCRMNRIGRVAFLSSTEGVILLNAVRLSPVNKEEIRGLILEFQKLLRGTFSPTYPGFSALREIREISMISVLILKNAGRS